MNQVNCKFCQKPFTPARQGTTFCKSKCRQDYKNRRRAYEKAVAQKEKDLENLQLKLEEVQQSLKAHKEQILIQDKKDKQEQEQDARFKATYEKIAQLSNEQLYKLICEQELKNETDPKEREYLKDYFRFNDEDVKESIVADYRKEKANTLELIKQRGIRRLLNSPLFKEDFKQKELSDQIESLETEITTLKQVQIKMNLPSPPLIALKGLGEKMNKSDKQDPMAETHKQSQMEKFTGLEIRNMHFDAFTLSGELGKFLGQLDRNMIAFALTGDSSAGKSYFSYELARLFVDNNMSVCYFSMEEGVGQLTQNKLDLFDLGNEIEVVKNAQLEDVDREAENYDVIIVDSYSKMAKKPKYYDLLRRTHPRTLFMVIFQKTTANTIRGGASITFDSSAIINVYKIKDKDKGTEERFAVMKKSRYGTSNWVYSITQGRITHRE